MASNIEDRLYGLALHQVYKYYRTFRSDTSFIRVLVSHCLFALRLLSYNGINADISVRLVSC